LFIFKQLKLPEKIEHSREHAKFHKLKISDLMLFINIICVAQRLIAAYPKILGEKLNRAKVVIILK